ncbi:MAG: histidine kinase [Hyphomonadaceae bacterium]|nr:histidine kinase [Hyphomonadaceae bacterium]
MRRWLVWLQGESDPKGERLRAFLIFQAVFWTAALLIRTFAALEYRPHLAFGYLPDRILIVLASIAGTTLVHAALLRVEGWSQLRRMALAFALCLLLMPPMGTLELSLAARLGQEEAGGVSFAEYVLQFGWIYVMWIGYYFALDQLYRTKRAAEAHARADRQAHAAELKMLRYQLNPHFLFNSLNAISTLVLEKKNAEAEAMILRLCRFLRHTVDIDPAPLSRLGDEARIQRIYLEIEAVRFGDNLRVECDVPAELHDCQVPSLLLQPIIENAIKHGVSRLPDGGWIHIRAQREGARLKLTVENDGPPLREDIAEHRGVGLRNTEERLRTVYGAAAHVRLTARPQGGARVEIVLPCEHAALERELAPA